MIREFTPADDLAALTTLLNRGYAAMAARGIRFLASYQTPDVTAERIGRGRCFVIEQGSRLVGTATLYSPDSEATIEAYRDPRTFHFVQFAVDPDFRGQGLGNQLHAHLLQIARSLGGTHMAIDTAEDAAELIAMYARWGYAKVGEHDWPDADYHSVVMRRAI